MAINTTPTWFKVEWGHLTGCLDDGAAHSGFGLGPPTPTIHSNLGRKYGTSADVSGGGERLAKFDVDATRQRDTER